MDLPLHVYARKRGLYYSKIVHDELQAHPF
jgi:hypothetical protein